MSVIFGTPADNPIVCCDAKGCEETSETMAYTATFGHDKTLHPPFKIEGRWYFAAAPLWWVRREKVHLCPGCNPEGS